MGIHPTNIAVERQTKCIGRGFGDCQAGAQNGIGAQFGFVGSAIQIQQELIDHLLFDCIPPNQRVSDIFVDIIHSLENALTQEAAFVAVSHFQGFMDTGGCAGGHGCAAHRAIHQCDFDFYSRVAA